MKKLQLNPDPKKIQQLFSGRLYSDKHHFITEVVSNAKDAHTRIKQTKPVKVSVLRSPDPTLLIFEVRDYGCSMTPDEFREKIGVLAYSDKEDEVETIGNMGIGSIAFTAFSKKATYTCIKNGEEFTCTIEETEEGIVYDDNFIVKESTEPQGVIFRVTFPNASFYDMKFHILSKLAYFSDISYDFLGDVSCNNFNIHRNDLFQISDNCSDIILHLTLDDVYYPINFSKLDIPPISLPIAIRFTTQDKIRVSTTRESIIYDETVKNLILSKIELLKKDLIERWNLLQKGINLNLGEAIHYLKHPPLPELKLGGHLINLKSILNRKEMDSLEKPKFPQEYSLEILKLIAEDNFSLINNNWIISMSKGGFNFYSFHLDVFKKDKSIILVDPIKFKSKAKSFVNFYCNSLDIASYNVVYKKHLKLQQYKNILGLTRKPKDQWRNLIIDYQKVVAGFEANFIDWTKEIPYNEEFEKSRKKVKKEPSPVFNVSIWKTSSWQAGIRTLDDLKKENCFTIYAYRSDKPKIEKLGHLIAPTKNYQLMLLNKKEVESLNELKLKNFTTYSEFMDNYPKLSKAYSSYLVNNFVAQNRQFFRNKEIIEKYICKQLAQDMELITQSIYRSEFNYLDEELAKELAEILKKNNLIDPKLGILMDRVKKGFEDFKFIEYFADTLKSNKPDLIRESLRIIRDVAFTRRKRLNWETYTLDVEKIKDEKKES